jgi:tRNA threonylcarbamoyladenosine biosynthesis protein TsaB
MAPILNLETSASLCSVALTEEGNVLLFKEVLQPNAHSAELATIVQNILSESKNTPDAIAVSIGPGSYTGLRIGLSLAKGLAYRMNIPLIAIPTLKIIASGFLQSNPPLEKNSLLVPLTDARRMEVYLAIYNQSLEEKLSPRPYVLDENNNEIFQNNIHYHFFGAGVEKAQTLLKSPTYSFHNSTFLSARYMSILSYEMFTNRQFADVAYQTPQYLKEFQALTSKKDILRQGTTFDKQIKKK